MAIDRTPRQAIMDGIRNAEERFHENDRIPSIQWPEMADKIIEALREAGYSFASKLTSDDIEVL